MNHFFLLISQLYVTEDLSLLFSQLGKIGKTMLRSFYTFIYLNIYIFVLVLCMKGQVSVRLARPQPQDLGTPALYASLF